MSNNVIYIKPQDLNEIKYNTVLGKVNIYKTPNNNFTYINQPTFYNITDETKIEDTFVDNDFTLINPFSLTIRRYEIIKGKIILPSECEVLLYFTAWMLK